MKKLLASASILALSSVAVSAADLPMKAPPYIAPIPVFSWTGCYVGAHVGGGSMHDSFSALDASFDGESSKTGTGTGAVAGGQIGCNYQDGNAVFGIEGEGYWSSLKNNSGFVSSFEGLDVFTGQTKNKSDFDIAARFGIAFDRTMVYGKAGWVWGQFDFFGTDQCCSVGSTVFSSAGSATLNGLLLGVGVEHALTRNWTVKLEYNFLDFGSRGVNFTSLCGGTVCDVFSQTQHVQKQIIKVGFNYLFNVWGAPPVVAKY
jgi:outer membrane immunogenic protein